MNHEHNRANLGASVSHEGLSGRRVIRAIREYTRR